MAEGKVRLTRCEMRVLYLVQEGCTNKEIAAHLRRSINTVEFHLENIRRKLNVNNRTRAVRVAERLGILPTSTLPLPNL